MSPNPRRAVAALVAPAAGVPAVAAPAVVAAAVAAQVLPPVLQRRHRRVAVLQPSSNRTQFPMKREYDYSTTGDNSACWYKKSLFSAVSGTSKNGKASNLSSAGRT